MRKIALLFTGVLLLFSIAPAKDWSAGYWMNQTLQSIVNTSQYATEVTGYGYNDGICVLGAFIQVGSSVSWVTNLEAGQSYMFIGAGNEAATDVDIKVTDSSGKILGADVKTDATPILSFSPSTTGLYTITLTLYSATTNCFCAMALLKQNGFNIPVTNLSQASERLLQFGATVDDTYGVRFHDYDNQWCLFGTVLDASQYITITNITMGDENHFLLARSDNNSQDIDLHLLDSDNNVLASDTALDDQPLIQYQTKSSQRYNLKIENYTSNGLSLIMAAILTN